ncbi:AAA family ATPase [Mollicutes bacterium LVI A0039]|nr:AAA family ATPase [Mollicutes bacterium LVI A0039]
MLFRKNEAKIRAFINESVYKSMLLVGVRQCGKTTLLKNMFKDENMLYCNLEERSDIADVFNGNLTATSLIEDIELLLNSYFDNDSLKILVIDEIQVNPKAITALKYFDESNENIKVIGSGSLLGVQLKQGDFSFPVGKVDLLNMYPLDFEEFLINIKMNNHAKRIRECFETNKPMPESLHEMLLETLNTFLEVGSMPQAVDAFIKGNRKDIDLIHRNLNEGYLNDIAKYIANNDKAYMRLILENLGNELLKENQKFKLSNLKSGLKYQAVENSFSWLANTDITYKASILANKKVTLPLKANIKKNRFKLFYCDTALLLSKMNYNLSQVKNNDNIYIGVVIENYVATELYKNYNKELYSFNDNSKEIDFLIEQDNMVIPIEVKAARNTKSKSLKVFMEQNQTELAYRVSQKNFGMENNIKSIPLYASFLI